MIDLIQIGKRLRECRNERQWSIRRLAEESGLSQRYLVSAEHGKANLSLQKLARVCDSLTISVASVLVSDEVLPCLQLLEGRGADDLREIRGLLEQKLVRDARRQKIALLGVRGAGKSTVGRLLADKLNYTFVELDHEIERVADLRLAEIFAWHGEAYYRRLEHEVATTMLRNETPMVIATGGGIVNHSETYALLQSMAISVWLDASAEAHWSRVVAQGDDRPMRDHPHAMSELRTLLASRRPLYLQADHRIHTESITAADVVASLVELFS